MPVFRNLKRNWKVMEAKWCLAAAQLPHSNMPKTKLGVSITSVFCSHPKPTEGLLILQKSIQISTSVKLPLLLPGTLSLLPCYPGLLQETTLQEVAHSRKFSTDSKPESDGQVPKKSCKSHKSWHDNWHPTRGTFQCHLKDR